MSNKVNYLYYACDGVCLPDGYYFDPRQFLSLFISLFHSHPPYLLTCDSKLTFLVAQYLYGCWQTVLPEIKIAVERCGCNSSFSLSRSTSLAIVMIGMLLIYFF